MGTLSRFQKYMEGRKALLPGAVLLSSISTLVGMLPYIFIWLIVRELFSLQPDMSQNLIDRYAWIAMGTAAGGIVIYFLALTLSHLAAFRVETNLRRKSMEKIVYFPLGFFDNNTSGRIRKIIDDNASITHSFLAHQMPDLAGTVLMPIVSVMLIMIFDWKLGLACLVPVGLSLVMMGMMMGKKGRQFMKSYMSSLEDMNTEAVEYVRGIPVVKVFQQTVFSFKSFHSSIMKYKEMVYKYTLMWEKPMSTYLVVIHGFAYILIPVAILLVGSSGDYATVILNLIFYILITPIFSQCIMKSMHLSQAVGQAREAINRIEELINISPMEVPSHPKSIVKHDISFDKVSFSYPGSGQKAVDDISFKIEEGKTYALVGPSGSGKTTIARLVPRFWDVDEGRVSIGGIDVKDVLPENLMQNVSFVFQNSRLFKTSLLENINYGNPDATRAEIEKAVDMAQCREFIEKMPMGLDTIIGTEGTYLSGGEQQRIALARAILNDAPIIVLDEATAFADPENEHLIHKALEKLTEGKTVLMIAHRLTSVMDVDSILVIDRGVIAEQGTHNELLDKNGLYTNMWNEYQKSAHWTIAKEIV